MKSPPRSAPGTSLSPPRRQGGEGGRRAKRVGGLQLTTALEVLSEPQRVRLLRVIEEDELGVGDLTRVLGLPQSTVSRHLKTLIVAGWVNRRAVATQAMVRLAREALSPEALALWQIVRDDPELATEREADRGRLALVLAERAADAQTFFGRVASGWDALRDQLFGKGFFVPAVLGLLEPESVIADLGSGTGELLAKLAPFAAQTTGVDREPTMVAAARHRLAAFPHARCLEGPLEALPIETATVDLALMVLVLHHVPEPTRALLEAGRILKTGETGGSGGRLVVVDMQPHDNDNWRAFGHVHKGFAETDLDRFVRGSGLHRDRYVKLPADPEAQGPPLFVASFERRAARGRPMPARSKKKA